MPEVPLKTFLYELPSKCYNNPKLRYTYGNQQGKLCITTNPGGLQ